MTGLTERRTSVEDALGLILESVSRGPVEMVGLADAFARVLAEPVVASEDLWPFPRAAMDGIAVRSADVAAASPQAPVALRVVGAVYSGEVWPAPLEPGTAIKIATGTPIPAGADAVIPREFVEWREDHAIIAAPIPPGRHVFAAGEDARAGDVVLEAGTVLGGGDLGLLAAVGWDSVPVVRRPVVAVLATGDELVPPSALLRPGQVRESNTYALAAEITALGGLPRLLGVAPDRAAEIEAKIREGLTSDALVICGGASVGDRDLVHDALGRVGVAMKFAGVAMKPGGPVAFGVYDGRPAFALPGTPGAARMAFEVLVRPALCLMAGYRNLHRPAVVGRLRSALTVTPGRRRYLWGHAVLTPVGVQVTPLRGQGTATLRSASQANALIEVGPEDARLPAGSEVTVHLLTRDAVPASSDGGPAAIAVVGAQGAGKTTLIERLIPELRGRGLAVAVVKHHAHMADPDAPGTDTARYAASGALETVLAGPGAVVRRLTHAEDPPLHHVLAAVGPADLVLVEGYSGASLPKILVERSGIVSDRPVPSGPILAIVSDAPMSWAPGTEGARRFGWADTEALATFLARRAAVAGGGF